MLKLCMCSSPKGSSVIRGNACVRSYFLDVLDAFPIQRVRLCCGRAGTKCRQNTIAMGREIGAGKIIVKWKLSRFQKKRMGKLLNMLCSNLITTNIYPDRGSNNCDGSRG
jgi:hypothetical protein